MKTTTQQKPPAKQRQVIGEDPLDALLSSPHPQKTPPSQKQAPQVRSPRASLEAKQVRKVRATFHLPEPLFEEARDAAVFLAGPPVRLTLAALAESAIRRELDRLKKAHHEGKPFPRRQSDLRGGRPIGS